MLEPISDKPEVLEKLQSANTGADVVSIVGDISIAKVIGQYSKEPAVRKAVMLLASGGPDLAAEERGKRMAALAILWSVKDLRSLVDEFAPRALVEPLADVSAILPYQDRVLIAAWLSKKKMAWIIDFAAMSAISESEEERLCQCYVTLLLGRAPSFAFALQGLNNAIDSVDLTHRRFDAKRIVNLCVALAHAAGKTSVPLGKRFSQILMEFVIVRVLQGGDIMSRDVRSQTGLGVAAFISALAQRSPSLLLSETLFEIVTTLERTWIPVEEKKWVRIKKSFMDQIGQLVTLFSLSGMVASDLVRNARLLEKPKGSFAKLCRKILEENDVSSEEVTAWLLRGGNDEGLPKKSPPEPRTDVEALATVMLRAEELESAASREPMAPGNPLLQALLTEINQMAVRKGLQLDGRRNGVVAYDPLRQRSVGPVEIGTRVGVLVPGVVRKTAAGQFQIIQAVVQPIGRDTLERSK
jgi:hypothetical protein